METLQNRRALLARRPADGTPGHPAYLGLTLLGKPTQGAALGGHDRGTMQIALGLAG